uniref:Serine protease n=1 Tax=Euperipatoides rowelli TaxID=49087 RepID=D9IX85_EUPRO|nr:serine protease [Euperipatoides rowelli]
MYKLCFLLVVAAIFLIQEISAVSDTPCNLEIVPGMCRAYMPRWGFDRDRKMCREFIYGGCNGNSNSFATSGDCVKTCGGPIIMHG